MDQAHGLAGALVCMYNIYRVLGEFRANARVNLIASLRSAVCS